MIRLQMLYRREKRLDDELQRWHAQADMFNREDVGVRAVARQLERWSQNQSEARCDPEGGSYILENARAT